MAEAVLVSGGSGGLGSATARALAARGWTPIIAYAQAAAAAETLAAEVGGRAFALDLCDEIAIERAVGQLAALDVPLTAILLAASPAPRIAPFSRFDAEYAARLWQVNVAGPRRLLAGLIKQGLQARKRGTVVAVLTKAMGLDGTKLMTQMSDYLVAKSGLAGLMAVVAAEYPWLRVETVSPGFIETPMLDAFDAGMLDILRARMPEGRFALAGEIAVQIAALIGDPQSS